MEATEPQGTGQDSSSQGEDGHQPSIQQPLFRGFLAPPRALGRRESKPRSLSRAGQAGKGNSHSLFHPLGWLLQPWCQHWLG